MQVSVDTTSQIERRITVQVPAAEVDEAVVDPLHVNLRSAEALDALSKCNVIFGAVDHDAPRLILTELAAAYEIPLIDSATEIEIDDGKLLGFVTSGGYGHHVGQSLALAYVDKELAGTDVALTLDVIGEHRMAVIPESRQGR